MACFSPTTCEVVSHGRSHEDEISYVTVCERLPSLFVQFRYLDRLSLDLIGMTPASRDLPQTDLWIEKRNGCKVHAAVIQQSQRPQLQPILSCRLRLQLRGHVLDVG